MEASAATPLVNGRFLLLDNLGRGGMGTVYRAFDRSRERIVALKLLSERRRPGPGHPLSEEYRAWARLRHPNIIRALGMGRCRRGPFPRGTPYLVLESFAGVPAHRALPPGSVEPALLEEFARQSLLALDHIHSRNLVHRDLKPGNILVARKRRGPVRIKVTDFGLATSAGSTGRPGKVSGSLPYVSPESILGARVDGRSDLYGLGILLYYLSAGELPCRHRDPGAILKWHLAGKTADLRRTGRELPERWARFVLRLTARNPAGRPATASEALFLLGACTPRRRPGEPGRDANPEIARLRLAMDAVRLGARSAVELPSPPALARRSTAELRVLAQIHGVQYFELHGRTAGRCDLGRIVLELLLKRGTGVQALVRRYSLHRGLPLELLGGIPVWDRVRASNLAAECDPAIRNRTARGIARFLLDSSSAGSMIVSVERAALRIPLVRATILNLRRWLAATERSPRGDGGFLLLLPGGGDPGTVQEQPLVAPQLTQT